MIKLQTSWSGEDKWEDLEDLPTWESLQDARDYIDDEGWEDILGDKYWKRDFRLIDTSDVNKPLALYLFAAYNDAPTLEILSENPLSEIQDAYGFTDSLMAELCEKYLKAKKG